MGPTCNEEATTCSPVGFYVSVSCMHRHASLIQAAVRCSRCSLVAGSTRKQ